MIPFFFGLIFGEFQGVRRVGASCNSVSFASTTITSLVFAGVKEDVFTKNAEMRLMCSEPKHDKIGVEAVNHMTLVGIMGRHGTLRSDEVHDFVFAFAGNRGIGDDDFHVPPRWIGREFVRTPILQTGSEHEHEGRAWCDGVGVPGFLDDLV